MVDGVDPPELPEEQRVADERTTLLSMLDFYRTVLVRKAWGLTPEQLATPLPPSDLTLGGLLLHMAAVEDGWFHRHFAGGGLIEPWASAPWDAQPDWELEVAQEWAPGDLHAQFQASVARSRAVTADASLDQMAVGEGRDPCNLRWIVVHLIEEYARHCGHADLLRQAIDGATGD